MNSPRLQLLVDRLRFARQYTLGLLDDFHDDEWFAMPGGITHAAWQAGHLAFAQYRMCLVRIRGELPEDEQLISSHLLKLFGAGSEPNPDATLYPAPAEIRALMARVHETALGVVSGLGDSELDEPVLRPHKLFSTKLESLGWCSMHEMTHAGQLGMLRRLLGKRPQW